jgi:hypothetical protein
MQCDVYVGGNRLFRMGVEHNKVHGMPPYVASGAVLVKNKNLKSALHIDFYVVNVLTCEGKTKKGEMAMLTGEKRSATVVAATKVCKINYTCIYNDIYIAI